MRWRLWTTISENGFGRFPDLLIPPITLEIPGPMVGLLLKQVKADHKRITFWSRLASSSQSQQAHGDIATVDVDWVVL